MPWDGRDPREWTKPPSWGKGDRPPPEPSSSPMNPEAFLAGLGAVAAGVWIFGYETAVVSFAMFICTVVTIDWQHKKKARSK